MPGNGPGERASPEMEPGKSPVGWVPGLLPLPSPLTTPSPVQEPKGKGAQKSWKREAVRALPDLMGTQQTANFLLHLLPLPPALPPPPSSLLPPPLAASCYSLFLRLAGRGPDNLRRLGQQCCQPSGSREGGRPGAAWPSVWPSRQPPPPQLGRWSHVTGCALVPGSCALPGAHLRHEVHGYAPASWCCLPRPSRARMSDL